APWMRRWVPFSSYTASAANTSFALLQFLSLYAVIEAFTISMTFAMTILLYYRAEAESRTLPRLAVNLISGHESAMGSIASVLRCLRQVRLASQCGQTTHRSEST